MTSIKAWRSFKKSAAFEWGKCAFKMKQLPLMGVFCIAMLIIVYRTMIHQYQQTEIEERESLPSVDTIKDTAIASGLLDGLPQGIIHPRSDLEMKPLWSTHHLKSELQDDAPSNHNLLAIPAGIKQKQNIDAIVRKFLTGKFTVILFHYDGNVNGWWDLEWSNRAIHIVAKNQTKWWFAKRFLHPAVVSMYDYIFLWDEDLGVEHFNPERYLDIVRTEGLEISQPALDPNSTEIHHRITVRARTKRFHRRVYESRGSTRCSDVSDGPPCTGFVEGMAPVFSRAAWYCAWHLIQNDLVHGWGMDMKLGYCAQVRCNSVRWQACRASNTRFRLTWLYGCRHGYVQGDRTMKVGIVDREFIVHHAIQTLGGGGPPNRKRHVATPMDHPRMEIRRQSTWELQVFKERWNKAVMEDKGWVDPFARTRSRRRRHKIDEH